MASRFNRKSTAALLASVTIFGAAGAAGATGVTSGSETPAVSTPAEGENNNGNGGQGQQGQGQGNLGENGAGQHNQATEPTAPASQPAADPTMEPTPSESPSEAPAPVFLTNTLTDIQAESPVHVQLVDANTTYTGDLPAGVTLVNGLLSGTPTTAGSSTFHVTATNAENKTAEQTFTLNVTPAPIPEPTETQSAEPTAEPTVEPTPSASATPTVEPSVTSSASSVKLKSSSHQDPSVKGTGASVNNATVVKGGTTTISGSGFEAVLLGTGSVTCSVDDTDIATAQVHQDGTFSDTSLTVNLAPGPHTMSCYGYSDQSRISADATLTVVTANPKVNNASVVKGGTTTLSGTGFLGLSSVQCVLGTVGSNTATVLGEFSVDPDTGAFSGTSNTINLDPNGSPYTFSCYGGSGGGTLDASASLEVTNPAPVTLSVPEGPQPINKPVNISGTGQPGDSIQVTIAGQVIATRTVGQDGKWSTSYTPTREQLGKTLAVAAKDLTNNTQAAGSLEIVAAVPLTMTAPSGWQPPEKPVIITGTGQPGDVILVYNYKKTLEMVTVDKEGKWSITYNPDTEDEGRVISLVAIDYASAKSAYAEVKIAKRGWLSVDVPSGTYNVGDNVTITGTAPQSTRVEGALAKVAADNAQNSVEVRVAGKLIGTVPVDANGKWSIQYTITADDAGKTLPVVAKDTMTGSEATGYLKVNATPAPTPPGPTPAPTPTPTPGPNPGPAPAPQPAPWPDNGGNNNGSWNGNNGWAPDNGSVVLSGNTSAPQWFAYAGDQESYTVSVPGFAPGSSVVVELFDAFGNVIASQTVTADAHGVAYATFTGLNQGVYEVKAHGVDTAGTQVTQATKVCIGNSGQVQGYALNNNAPINTASTGVTAEAVKAETPAKAEAAPKSETHERKAPAASGVLANTGVSDQTAGMVLGAAGLAATAGGASIMIARRNKKA